MTTGLFFTQLLNGLQLGVLLFLLSAGLTLVFGIMNVVNLAHGSLYMMGAYFAAAGFNAFDGSFLAAALVAIPGTLLLGLLIERMVLASLYQRDHLDQVLATFGLILFFNEVVRYRLGRLVGVHERAGLAVGHRQPVRPALPVVPLRDHRRRPGRGVRRCTR